MHPVTVNHDLDPEHRPVNRAYLSHDVPIIGPVGVAVTGITTTARRAIGHDFVRHGILFFNPNPQTTVRVFPLEGDPLRAGEGGIVIPPWGYYELYAATGGNLGEDWSRVRINCGWQVVADDDVEGGAELTIWNYSDIGKAVQATANLLIDVGIRSPMGRQFREIQTTSTRIMHPFQNRRGVLFHNPGPALKAIAPANLPASFGGGSIILKPGASREFRAFGKVRQNAAFDAVTADPSDGTLSALEYV